ncbi:microtubule-associated protein 60 [Musca autumnalis]|uniref:microtubule-associated protein 60 n=1 Tax=Musca autumnalis TaxID=221902 RepID=UPI003CF8C1EE
MPIQLDKILADIANEVVLHPNYQGATKKEIDDAWARVGKNSNLSVHESRSIFKVLQKKYDQEKLKESSAWKLFAVMDKIHKKVETKPETPVKEEEANTPMEEDEEYEMLEVQEEEDGGGHQGAHNSGESGSEAESPNKSNQSYNTTTSPDKSEDQKPLNNKSVTNKQQTTPTSSSSPGSENIRPNAGAGAKLLNSMATVPTTKPNVATTPTSVTAAALQKKGITMKKTSAVTPANQQGRSIIKTQQARSAANAGAMHGLEVGKTIQLSESLKRKLSTEPTTPQNKRMNQQHTPQSTKGSPTSSSAKSSPQAQQQQHTTTAQLLQLKQDCQEQQQRQQNNSGTTPPGINVITIPANPSGNLVNGIINTNAGAGGPSSSTAATVASTTSTNGFSPRIEDIDFRNDIIFDSNNAVNGATIAGKVPNTSEIINLGNFDNSLPPTFFKNLCNSSRHEALGLYVANVMNRLRPRSAAKLEVGILRAILDVQSEELDQ